MSAEIEQKLIARGLRCGAVAVIALGLSIGITPAQDTQPAPDTQDEDMPFPIAAWSRTTAAVETDGSLNARGAAVFNNWCSACHSRGPMNAPGTRSLDFKYRGELPAALEDRRDLTPELIELYVRSGVATMPFYRPTEISDEDLGALADYLSGP